MALWHRSESFSACTYPSLERKVVKMRRLQGGLMQRQFLHLTDPSIKRLEFESNLFQIDSQKHLVVLFQFKLSCTGGSSRTRNGSN